VSHGLFIGRAPPLRIISPQNDSILTWFRGQNRGKAALSTLVVDIHRRFARWPQLAQPSGGQ
jgi:hypothetical protein